MPSHSLKSSVLAAPRRLAGVLLWAALSAGAATRAAAQVDVQPVAPLTPRADSAAVVQQPWGVSPRGAFLRAVLVPGWGHAAIGAWNRGAFYVTIESATAWALVKTQKRVQEARERIAFREDFVRAELAARNQVDPDSIQAALDADETLQDLTSLEESRRQQREDWVALGIFFVFLSGADAYVSAHLQHFPEPIEVNAVPVGGGRMELSVSVKLPR
jgi:hypothetical protein